MSSQQLLQVNQVWCISWVYLYGNNKRFGFSLLFFEGLAINSREVLTASESNIHLFLHVSDWDILKVSEVQNKIKVVWMKFNALPSEFKLREIRINSWNEYKIDYR
jgi:hypothetical protein